MSEFLWGHVVLDPDGKPAPPNTLVSIQSLSGAAVQPRDLSGTAVELRTGELGSLPPWTTLEELPRAYAVINGRKNPVISEALWAYIDNIPVMMDEITSAETQSTSAVSLANTALASARAGMDLTKIQVDPTTMTRELVNGVLMLGAKQQTTSGSGSGVAAPTGTMPVFLVRQRDDKTWPTVATSTSYALLLKPAAGQTTVTPPSWYDPTRCEWLGTSTVTNPPTGGGTDPGTGTGTGSTSPSALTVTKGADASATAAWTAAANPSAGWQIDVTGPLASGATSWTSPSPVPGTARSASISGLKAGSTYTVKVTSLTDQTSVSATYATAATGALVVTATSTADGIGTVSWESATSPAGGWTYGRDGTDSSGYGAWSGPVDGSRRAATFTFLRNDTEYTFTVTNNDTLQSGSAKTTVPAATTGGGTGGNTGGTPAPATGLGVAAAKLWNQALSGDSPIHSGIWAGSDAPGCTVTGHANRVIGMQTWRGRKSATVMCFGQAGDAMNTGPVGTYLNKPELAGAKMIARIMVRDSVGQRTLAQCATGASDGIFQAWANALKNAGYLDPLIGIGWEAQGNWTPNWISGGAGNRYEDYAAVVARARTVIKAILPNARIGIEFLLGNGPLPGYTDASMIAAMCTGTGADAWVMDTYDFYNTAAVTDAEWNSNILSRLTPLAASCRQTGMVITRTEWNITTPDTAGFEGGSSNGGHGDNVFYIRKFHEWDLANTDVMALECIFAEGGSGQNRGFWNPVQNPLCSAYYKSKFGTTYAV